MDTVEFTGFTGISGIHSEEETAIGCIATSPIIRPMVKRATSMKFTNLRNNLMVYGCDFVGDNGEKDELDSILSTLSTESNESKREETESTNELLGILKNRPRFNSSNTLIQDTCRGLIQPKPNKNYRKMNSAREILRPERVSNPIFKNFEQCKNNINNPANFFGRNFCDLNENN